MTGISDDLLARIRQRAADPDRRYMTAAADQSAVELPVEGIIRRHEAWHANNRALAREAALRDGMSPAEYDRKAQAERDRQARLGLGPAAQFAAMFEQMRAWGQIPSSSMTFVETEGHSGASGRPLGATPLTAPPDERNWATLEQIVGRPMPRDLKRLYSIADGGFGPGFTGLNPLQQVGTCYEDFRRRGPDYCCTIDYPASFVPFAQEMLDYHYDLDSGRIISSNQSWNTIPDEPQDVYDIAFQNLADMMEDWLVRS